MYLRKATYQLGLCVKKHAHCFHKSHPENHVLLVIEVVTVGSSRYQEPPAPYAKSESKRDLNNLRDCSSERELLLLMCSSRLSEKFSEG